MPYTEHGKNAMLDAIASGKAPKAIDRVSMHTAEPNAEGSNEVTGGEYARQKIEWNAASGGSVDDKTNGVKFKIPAGTTVKYVGYWSDASGTPKLEAFNKLKDKEGKEIEGETFTGAGEYELSDADLDLNK